MSDQPEVFDHMYAAWNEVDPERVRSHLEKALAPDVRFVDPSIDLTGIDAFEANVHDVHANHPGNSYGIASKIDSHHNVHRYYWEIRSSEDKLVLPGFDVVEVNAQGLVAAVYGFFGVLRRRA